MAPVVVGDVTVVLPHAGHPPDTIYPIRNGIKTLSNQSQKFFNLPFSLLAYIHTILYYAAFCIAVCGQQTFPEKELCGLSPNSYIHASSDLYIPTISLPILLFFIPRFYYRKIGGPIVGIYRSITGTWMWKSGLRLRNSFAGNT